MNPEPVLLLRPARVEDAPRVADIFLASRHTHVPFAPLVHSDAEVRRWIAGRVALGGGVTVAERAGRLLGYVELGEEPDAGWIEQLYLDPAEVGHGVGSQLLQAALAQLATRALPVRLYTFQANAGARRFYERHGFRAVAFGDGSGNEEGCPDVLYELEIASKQNAIAFCVPI
jgi:GNAT superfamily N-acetyltransferase